jgi:hypothetical protein
VIVAVPEPFSKMVWLPGVPLTVYVAVALGVPVNVIVAVPPEQTVALAEMVTFGGGITVIVTVPVIGWLQLGVPADATLTSVKVVVAVYVPVTAAVPEPFKTTVWLPGVPDTVYVTVAFGVPVKLTVALPPEQMVVFDAMAAVGNGKTVIVTVPAAGLVQTGVPLVAALTNV